jgi:endonuclease-3
MQFTLNLHDETRRLEAIDEALHVHISLPIVTRRLNPTDQLVKGILGSRTRSEISMAAMLSLKNSFASWDDVRDASKDEIFRHVRHTTFPEKKVEHLQASFRKISAQQGGVSLNHLESVSTVDAMRWLETLPGVGRKISASVMNASTLRRRALVIDTHHLRILKRLGFLSPAANFNTAYDRMMPLLPQEWTATRIDDHHRLFKRLGQIWCRHGRPKCLSCPLRDQCHSARNPEGRTISATSQINLGVVNPVS